MQINDFIMNSSDFNDARKFLEKLLEQDQSNSGILATYTKLLTLKSKYDLKTDKAVIEKEIRQAELNVDLNKTHSSNSASVQMNYQDNAAQTQQSHYAHHHATQQAAWGAVPQMYNR